MHISETGLKLIRDFEGFSPTPYRCPAGLMTIGYGHVIDKSEAYTDAGISPKEAETLLKQDVNIVEQAIDRLVEVPLSQHQFDALVSLVYNIGTHAFEKSTLLRYLNAGDTEKAAREFSRWVYSRGRVLQGLKARREAESQLFRGNSGRFIKL